MLHNVIVRKEFPFRNKEAPFTEVLFKKMKTLKILTSFLQIKILIPKKQATYHSLFPLGYNTIFQKEQTQFI